MSEDIVVRLRTEEWATAEREKTRNEAASTIEALRGEVERFRADYEAMKSHNKELFGKLSAAEQEAARLKVALDRTGGFFVERTPELDAIFDDQAATTDVRQSMQQWIDHHNERADKAEAENDRLADALNEIAGFADDRPGEWAAMHARKALAGETT